MLKDLRHAVRMLLNAKGWTSIVVISLALGIGANTALFSATNALLLLNIPVKDPDTLVRLQWAGRNQMVNSSSEYGFLGKDAAGQDVRATFSYPMFLQFQKDNQTMTDLFACAPNGRVNVVVDGQAELATSFISSGNYYRVLGVTAPLGRTILPDDDRPDASPVAVISDKYWRTRFGSDPNVVNKVVGVNNVAVTIVGVLPPEFTGIQQAVADPPDMSFPLSLDTQLDPNTGNVNPSGQREPPRLTQPTWWWLQIMGRLKPGATAPQVQGNLEGIFQSTARAGLDSYLAGLSETARGNFNNRNRTAVPRLRVVDGSHGIYDVNSTDLRAVIILTVVVALVLLIVCANVANLLLSRATARQKEISVRLSMGATRWRLVRQLLTESLLLASIGGVLGIAVGYWGQRLLPDPRAAGAPLDWRVLSFVVAVTALTGVLFGIAPALRATRMDLAGVMKETSRSVHGSRSWLAKTLLVVQMAISVVLLVGAALFLRTLENLRNVDVGFDPNNLVQFRVNPQLNRYDEKRTALLYQELLDRLRTVAGVRSVALTQVPILSGGINQSSIFIQGRTYAPEQRDSIARMVVSPNFFELIGMRLQLGRGFTDNENNATAPKVVIINDAAAKKFFPNQNPVGLRLGTSLEDNSRYEIVGVVSDTKYNSMRDAPPATMYMPHLQTRMFSVVVYARTGADPLGVVNSIRAAVRQVDPNLPMIDVFTQMQQIDRRLQQERLFAQAYTLFGGLALVLAAIGLFGVMSYNVARRTNEIGIRMALGAERKTVLGMVMSESMLLVVVGAVIGVGLALAAGRLVTTLLYGVAATDALSMIIAITTMVLVAAAAGYLPARRASRVDPMVALRYE
jgi:predicted permease